ncbi:diguanylate cyclase domain-containing protein [Larsenimonas rhizosphaerae]|uniref:diguanylate cyclase n=1 Tax=Larsenimonas rhizosphaerae TaxID=2944682 RepID=A0AA41ZLV3_9GAMM|nr:diguanylate cyclase [Larsenimonas rhizosphaerae]MCX2523230.1 diguanylate cyclase [Larsenimonas rhizosphaerae]
MMRLSALLHSLRHRLLAALAITALVAIVLQVAFAWYLVVPGLLEAEKKRGLAATDQLISTINTRLDALGGDTRDWASWDQSVDFIVGNMPHYPEENFSEEMLQDTHHLMMAYFDADNRLAWVTGIDPATSRYGSCPGLETGCQWATPFITALQHHLSTQPDKLETWLLSSPLPAMVATSPIVPTDRGQAARSGWLAVIELIDTPWLENAAKQTGFTSTVVAPPPGQAPPPGETIITRNNDVMDVRHYIEAMPDTSLLEIYISIPRDEFHASHRHFFFITTALMTLFLAIMVVISLLVESMVLRPTRTLHEATRTLRRRIHDDMCLPPELTDRRDELGGLARDFQQLVNEERARSGTLLKQTRTDELTGLFNRREFDEMLETYLMNPAQYYPVSIILIDIDHFKLYNDHFGHPEGDQCLITVARLMKGCFNRPNDLVARTGGEEFSVLLPHTSTDEAMILGTRLKNRLKQRYIPHPTSPTAPWLTLSIGISNSGLTGHRSVRHLVKAADVALYAAKARGRDRVLTETGITRPLNEA